MKRLEVKSNASRGRRRAALVDTFKLYTEFVYADDKHRHPLCQNAADSVLCAPASDLGLPHWKCVLRECPDCHTIDLPPLELDCSNTAPTILFQTYMKQMRCAIHGVLTPVNITTIEWRLNQMKKACLPCELLVQARTLGFVRGKISVRKKLFKLERSIGEFHRSFYIPSIEKLAYHRSYYRILGKHHVADVRQKAFRSRPGDIATRSDYAEKFGFEPDGQLQGEYFSNNRSLSMEGCCLEHFLHTDNVRDTFSETPHDYVPDDSDVSKVFHSHLSDCAFQNACTTTQHVTLMLDVHFGTSRMKRFGTMWDQTDGCSAQYRCSKAFYLLSYLSVTYSISIDRAIDAPGHGKDVVDGLNATLKRFLGTCLRMTNMPEVHRGDGKRMNIHSMTDEGESSFAEECRRLLENRDKIGMHSDKKHAKREANAKVKKQFYHVHNEEDLKFNDVSVKYRFIDPSANVKMRDLYHIRCDPDLGLGNCALRRIPCACDGCVDQLSTNWQRNTPLLEQPRYAVESPNCKYSSILGGYNKWHIAELVRSNDTPPQEVQEMNEMILSGLAYSSAQHVELGEFGAFETKDKTTLGYYIVKWTATPYTLQEQFICDAFNPPIIIPPGEMVCAAKFMNPVSKDSLWYHEPPEDLNVTVKMKQVVMAQIDMEPVSNETKLPHRFKGYANMNPRLLASSIHDDILDNIRARDSYNYTEEVVDENYYYDNNTDEENDED
jgi:hypothetical protein